MSLKRFLLRRRNFGATSWGQSYKTQNTVKHDCVQQPPLGTKNSGRCLQVVIFKRSYYKSFKWDFKLWQLLSGGGGQLRFEGTKMTFL